MTKQHQHGQLDDTDAALREIAILTAVFTLPAEAKCVELALGRLSAESEVDLLDGVVIDWPATSPLPCWRAVRNVARTGALIPSSWDDELRRLVDRDLELTRRLHQGALATIVLVEAEQRARMADVLAVGAVTVTMVEMAGEEYRQLRSRR